MRFVSCRSGDGVWVVDRVKYQAMLILIIHIARSVYLTKQYSTGTLQGIMRQVVGCGVENIGH
jgi:hypothetical protein